MKMHVLSGGRLRMKRHVYEPLADRDEMIDIPVSCYLVRHAQGNVLFDTGCHPKVASDPEERWGGLAKFMIPVHGPGEDVLASLGAVGLGPEDIDVVVNSHLHCDHCGCNEFFSKASFIAHADELATAADAAMEGKGYFRADWDQGTQYDAIDGQRDVFGDERIVLVPLPGHSPGLIGALVNLDADGSFLLASDSVALRVNLDEDVTPKNTWAADLALGSYAEIRRIEAGGATVVCGHDAVQWAGMKKGMDAYA